ncbi:MAG: hypothetical protein JXR94_00990 [Candidatus Hydrogenedentes bacterium]|nr:hypothetical protein [Candidatus Hydrogenedentota bacterium]
MAPPGYLFDMEPYRRRPMPAAYKRLPPKLRAAFTRLKDSLDAIPPEEWDQRRRRWLELQRSLRPR